MRHLNKAKPGLYLDVYKQMESQQMALKVSLTLSPKRRRY